MFYINKNFANANIPRTIRFTTKLFAQLGETCSEHGISFNTLVLQCCYYALERLSNDSEQEKTH